MHFIELPTLDTALAKGDILILNKSTKTQRLPLKYTRQTQKAHGGHIETKRTLNIEQNRQSKLGGHTTT